jgi:hypothetical protein
MRKVLVLIAVVWMIAVAVRIFVPPDETPSRYVQITQECNVYMPDYSRVRYCLATRR